MGPIIYDYISICIESAQYLVSVDRLFYTFVFPIVGLPGS